MGCNIKSYVKIKLYPSNNENGVWINADKWSINEEYLMGDTTNSTKYQVRHEDRIYLGNSYYGFALLGSERDDYNIKPIYIPRWLPY